QHLVLRECGVPLSAAERPREVPPLHLAEPEPDAGTEEAVARVLPQRLGRIEEPPALVGEVVEREAEAAVQLGVVRRAEPLGLAVHDLVLAEVEDVVLLGRLVACLLEPLPDRAIRLVPDPRPEVAVRDLLVAAR